MRAVSLHIVFVSILLTTGCKTLFPDRRMVEPQRVRNFQVEFEHEVSSFEEERALFSIDYVIRAWERDHKVLPLGWTIRISSRLAVYWGPPWSDDPWFTLRTTGERALGWCIPSQQLVYITLGRWSNVPSLYHEFCHAALVPADVDHSDPRWDDWDDRGRELAWNLRVLAWGETPIGIWWDNLGE